MRLYYWLCRCVSNGRYFFRNFVFYLGHGFHLVEIWNMDTAAARWFTPRLRYLKTHHAGTPYDITDAEWTAIIGKMLRAFELMAAWDDDTEAKNAEIQAGLDLLPQYLRTLRD